MTDTHRETLSIGMDGELTQEELRFLLRRLDHDAELQQAWSRYHVARDGLRRQLPSLASEGFSARVMLAIGEESAVVAGSGRRRHWLRWSAGGAIAATVAVAALLVTQPAGPGADHAGTQVAVNSGHRPVPARANAAALASRADTPAAAPAWLSNYAGLPSALTQQASATVDGGEGATFLYSRNRLNPYQVDRYRAINNGDGSYLLLMQQPSQRAPQAPQLEPSAQ